MPNLEGRWLENRYHVEQFIGRGGMSEVYRVFDRDMNAPLAMKVLHEDLVDDAVVIRSFRRKVKVL